VNEQAVKNMDANNDDIKFECKVIETNKVRLVTRNGEDVGIVVELLVCQRKRDLKLERSKSTVM